MTRVGAVRRGRSLSAVWSGRAFLAAGMMLFVLAVLFVLRDAVKYVEWSPDVYQRFWRYRGLMAAHILAASIALVASPLQFFPAIRRNWPAIHRSLGWTYVVCALTTGVVALRMGMISDCYMCRPAFVIWSSVFLTVTAIAIILAVRRNFNAHRQFMVRSYVLMMGFVFVRLDTHFPYPLPDFPGVHRASMVIWVSWVVPFLLTEIWISWVPFLVGRRRAAAPAVAVRGDPKEVVVAPRNAPIP